MKIEKAIRIKENYLKLHSHELYKEIVEADRLGIEALKQIQQIRAYAKFLFLPLLPGETKE